MSMETAMKVLAAEPSQNSPKIVQDAPGSTLESQPSLTPKPKLQDVLNPKPEPTELKPPGAERFAALARQEKGLRQREQGIKEREARLSEFEGLKQQVSANPIKALEALGITYDQLAQFMLGQPPAPEDAVKKVESRLEQLEKQRLQEAEDAKKATKLKAEAEYKEVLEDFGREVRDYVTTNKDKYELTNMYEGQDTVQATIEAYFAKTKKIMSIEEASDLVEAYFEEQVQNAQKSKKFSKKEVGQPARELEGKTQPKGASPTLSNELTSSAPSLLPAKTENDRIARAMAALNK